jgi:prepilin-type N-terminal cleavage/methylation domain-containing protein
MTPVLRSRYGFTLVELMVAMAIGLIVTGAIYAMYQSYQRSQVAQQLAVDMQQNGRAAMALMKREIRMAGYNPILHDGIDNDCLGSVDDDNCAGTPPTGGCEWDTSTTPIPNITIAQNDQIQFNMDISAGNLSWCTDGVDNANSDQDCDADVDGDDALTDEWSECYNGNATDPGESLSYWFNPAHADGPVLQRDDLNLPGASGSSVLAYDVEALRFAYAFDYDGGSPDGFLDTANGQPDGDVIWAFDADGDGSLDTILDTNNDGLIDETDAEGGAAIPGGPVAYNASSNPYYPIKAVRIWLLVRTRHPVHGYTDTDTYVVGEQHLIQSELTGSNYKRMLLTATVDCRNM